MNNETVSVEVTDKNAIYVNNSRITNGNTKWGIHYTFRSFECLNNEVVSKLIETLSPDFKGFNVEGRPVGSNLHAAITSIDTEPYLTQLKKIKEL